MNSLSGMSRNTFVVSGDRLKFLDFYLRDKNNVFNILTVKLLGIRSTESEGECTVIGQILRRCVRGMGREWNGSRSYALF
jgi:hypothetical protein